MLSTDSFEHAVIELFAEKVFQQAINFPTRGDKTLVVAFYAYCCSTAVRDTAFTRLYDCSDHCEIKLTIKNMSTQTKGCIHDLKSYKSADFDGLRDHFEQLTLALTCFSNIDNTCIELYKYFDDAVNIHVATRTRHRQNLPRWITSATSFLLKKLEANKANKLPTRVIFLENNLAEAYEEDRVVYQEKLLGTATPTPSSST